MADRYKDCVESVVRNYYDGVQDEIDKMEYYEGIDVVDYTSLSELVSSTYSKGNRRIGLWALVDRQEDGTLLCAYSGKLIEGRDCVRLCKADEEHLVPQSWHKGSKSHPGRDMHQIFVVTKESNGSRGNCIFGKSGVLKKEKVGGNVYIGDGGRKYFLPSRNVGAVCRATLYTLLAYPGSFHRSYFPLESLGWIKEVAMSEPVSLWERHRNAELFKLQGNRNPFVDNPGWVEYIDFSKGYLT